MLCGKDEAYLLNLELRAASGKHLAQCLGTLLLFSHVQHFCSPVDCILPGFLCPWDFPGKNTGGGCHFLCPEHPGNLPEPGIEPASLLYWQVGSLPLSHLGSPWYIAHAK